MIRANHHYQKIHGSYIFREMAQQAAEFKKRHPEKSLISLGIGDVNGPLPESCLKAFTKSLTEMGNQETFRGYGPERGYPFLREAILKGDFLSRGVSSLSEDDIFISDGTKCDIGNFQELFASDARIAISDPVYPVYAESNVMAGRTGSYDRGRYEGIIYLESTKTNHFVPLPSRDLKADLIYLCSPNNPTGATMTREALEQWVAYAHSHRALILFDAAYVAFIRDKEIPRSIYEIEGAEEVAVEFRSFSKTASFTGIRCAYTVVPHSCRVWDEQGAPVSLQPLWNRRQATKFNGVCYPVQRAAEAVYSPEGQQEIHATIGGYLENASIIAHRMKKLGLSYTGGKNSPYVWVDLEEDSQKSFKKILDEGGVIVTPGVAFGRCGETFIRISAFNSQEKTLDALQRLEKILVGSSGS